MPAIVPGMCVKSFTDGLYFCITSHKDTNVSHFIRSPLRRFSIEQKKQHHRFISQAAAAHCLLPATVKICYLLYRYTGM